MLLGDCLCAPKLLKLSDSRVKISHSLVVHICKGMPEEMRGKNELQINISLFNFNCAELCYLELSPCTKISRAVVEESWSNMLYSL